MTVVDAADETIETVGADWESKVEGGTTTDEVFMVVQTWTLSLNVF